MDRGSHGVEIVMILFAFKVLYPGHVWVHRGNHECRCRCHCTFGALELVGGLHQSHDGGCPAVNFVMGFAEELMRKYGDRNQSNFSVGPPKEKMPSTAPHDLFELFEATFDALPLCSLIKDKIFVVSFLPVNEMRPSR